MASAPGGHWFEPIAATLGAAYNRYSFTRGTEQEADFLVEVLDLRPGQRVLDVGCGPGRHAHALARRGLRVHGVDISARFVRLAHDGAPSGATFQRGDARALAARPAFDAAISLCQGAFGLTGGPAAAASPGRQPVVPAPAWKDPDGVVLAQLAGALRPGGRVAISAFSAYFQVRYLEEHDTFDADAGVNHERTSIRDEQGRVHEAELWTSCFTPRELRLLAADAGIAVDAIWSVSPGAYRRDPPDVEHPEFLLLGHTPETHRGSGGPEAAARGLGGSTTHV